MSELLTMNIVEGILMSNIFPVILAGGSGTRLWPLSRKSFPKQFSAVTGKKTLFQDCVQRLNDKKKTVFERPIILTHFDYRFIVLDQLDEIGVEPHSILLEPVSKNTAPAILVACLHALEQDENAILIVAPSDHVISNLKSFKSSIFQGLEVAKKGGIATFGVRPIKAETGFGYLKCVVVPENEPTKVEKFIEKPKIQDAKVMFESGNYLWNSGIFMFKAKEISSQFKRRSPNLFHNVKKSLENKIEDLCFFKLDQNYWGDCGNISIDYALMEKTNNIEVIPLNSGWSDLGNWHSVWEELDCDENGVVMSSNAHAIDCKDTLLMSESTNQIVGVGLDNIVAVATSDAILVASKNKVQEVGKAVKELRQRNVPQVDKFNIEHRPWGWFETLVMTTSFHVKRISVNAHSALSLQSHRFRSEHWVVVEGTAEVTINEKIVEVSKGQSIYIPLGSKHRLANPGDHPIILIEVQTGSYFGEDDIIRYEDIYRRNSN